MRTGGWADPVGMAKLGAELERCSEQIGRAVLQWWLQRRPGPEPPSPGSCEDILTTVALGAATTGRYLMSGRLPSPEERDSLAAPGRAALDDSIPVDELAKLYLAHRDITCRELEVIAERVGVGWAAVQAAQELVRAGADSAIVAVVRSFDAARRQLQAALDSERESFAYRAVHDALTGLPNRALLVERLERMVSSSGPSEPTLERRDPRFAVLFIDVDRFKAVNDVSGHRSGDQLLMALAGRLQRVIRDGDILARLGGDEFVVVCPDLADPPAEAAAVAERITAVGAQPFRLGPDGEEIFVSVSVGIGVAAPGDTADSVLSRADAAMYSAKRGGGSGFRVYDDSVDSLLRRRPQLINDLHSATASGQMSLHYQPVRHLGSDRTRCMEALARWQHPVFGSVPPDEFIPLAEESGVILGFGRWVIGQALADCARWQAGPWPGVGVAVNVSGRQFADEGLPAYLAEQLSSTGVHPADVTLEITESVLVGTEEVTVATIGALSATGVRLAIDDFGTGYSSLAYLRRLPVTVVKVDRTFVAGSSLEAGGDGGIVAAMVDLAHSLGLTVVAEGVETPAELEMVRRAGCDDAQGYLLGRPVRLDPRRWSAPTPCAAQGPADPPAQPSGS